jgi:hypothetical protein
LRAVTAGELGDVRSYLETSRHLILETIGGLLEPKIDLLGRCLEWLEGADGCRFYLSGLSLIDVPMPEPAMDRYLHARK